MDENLWVDYMDRHSEKAMPKPSPTPYTVAVSLAGDGAAFAVFDLGEQGLVTDPVLNLKRTSPVWFAICAVVDFGAARYMVHGYDVEEIRPGGDGLMVKVSGDVADHYGRLNNCPPHNEFKLIRMWFDPDEIRDADVIGLWSDRAKIIEQYNRFTPGDRVSIRRRGSYTTGTVIDKVSFEDFRLHRIPSAMRANLVQERYTDMTSDSMFNDPAAGMIVAYVDQRGIARMGNFRLQQLTRIDGALSKAEIIAGHPCAPAEVQGLTDDEKLLRTLNMLANGTAGTKGLLPSQRQAVARAAELVQHHFAYSEIAKY